MKPEGMKSRLSNYQNEFDFFLIFFICFADIQFEFKMT